MCYGLRNAPSPVCGALCFAVTHPTSAIRPGSLIQNPKFQIGMTDSQQPENEKGLQQLAWAIASSVGQFKLILARCNYASLRDRLIQKLRQISQVE